MAFLYELAGRLGYSTSPISVTRPTLLLMQRRVILIDCANPGLGRSEIESFPIFTSYLFVPKNHAGSAEPFRVARPKAVGLKRTKKKCRLMKKNSARSQADGL